MAGGVTGVTAGNRTSYAPRTPNRLQNLRHKLFHPGQCSAPTRPRPNGMPPCSGLSHGSVTNLTLSWSFSLNKQWNTSLLWKETEGGTVLRVGKDAIQQGEAISTEVELRDRLLDLVSVGNLRHKPEALFTLFRQFLTRISPRD